MSYLRQRKALWLALQVLLAGATLFFLLRTVVVHWSQVSAYPWQFRPIPLAASMLLQLVAALFWATVWWHMVVRSGCPIRWDDGVRVYLLSSLAKYVPGSIWGYVGRVYLGEKQGLTTMGVGVSVLWEVGITIVASLLLTAVTIPAYPGEIPEPVLWLVLAVALLCFVGLLPPVFNRWIQLLRSLQSERKPPSFRWQDFFLYLISAFGTHVLVGTGFFLFARSLVDVDWHAWWSFVGLWSFSATAGLVVVLVPYGLGVKEGLLALFLQPLLTVESAAVISLASRLWTIAGELLAAIFVALLFYGSGVASRMGSSNPE